MYRSRSLKGQTADCGSAMRQVSVESFVTFFGLMGAAVWATANLVDSRYSKNSSIWILNNRLFFAARASLRWRVDHSSIVKSSLGMNILEVLPLASNASSAVSAAMIVAAMMARTESKYFRIVIISSGSASQAGGKAQGLPECFLGFPRLQCR